MIGIKNEKLKSLKNRRFFKPVVCASANATGRRKEQAQNRRMDAAEEKLAPILGTNFLQRKGMIFMAAGLFCGLLNGLFGSGGGTAAVPLFERMGLSPRTSHATSVALIFFLSISAAIGYGLGGNLNVSLALPLLPGGLLGAAVGSVLLKKIKNDLLRRIFGGLLLLAAGQMLLR